MHSQIHPEYTKILYVEDDPSSMNLVRRLLGAEGYQVVTATDGLAAIEVAERERPNLILMDINVSGLDGYEVTTKIRTIPDLDKIPIVAVTAATLKGDRERALAAGCDGYISKPIDVDRFPEQVRDFLLGMREEIESPEEKAEYLIEYNRKLVERLAGKVRELEAANIELQQIDTMKSDFIALAGHELRTPLTAIYGYVQMLLYSPQIPGEDDEEGSPRNMLRRIADATKRLNQVFDEIRNISLIDAKRLDLTWEPVVVVSLVQNVVDNLRNLGPARDLRFEFENLEGLPVIQGDQQRLYHALWNIVSNAMKYTPDGRHITISGQQIEEMVHISVQDTGVGIPPEQQERIFDRFYVLEDIQLHHTSKTEHRGGGLGLGLSVTRGVIEAHGGRVWAVSEGYDEVRLPGTTFHILLPIHKPEPT
jgi:signal transduction histidine kinase